VESEPDQDLEIVQALEDYQLRSLEVLESSRGNPEQAVKGLVSLHIEWTASDPERARTVSAGRHRVMAGPLGPRLRKANAKWMNSLRSWLDAERESGGLPTGSIAILHAVVFAPTQEIAKLWLAGLLPREIEDYRTPLAEAAWAGIRAADA
jgi:hypothetical protein